MAGQPMRERPGHFGQISRTPHSLTRRFRDGARHSPGPSTSTFHSREMGIPDTLEALAVNDRPRDSGAASRGPVPHTSRPHAQHVPSLDGPFKSWNRRRSSATDGNLAPMRPPTPSGPAPRQATRQLAANLQQPESAFRIQNPARFLPLGRDARPGNGKRCRRRSRFPNCCSGIQGVCPRISRRRDARGAGRATGRGQR